MIKLCKYLSHRPQTVHHQIFFSGFEADPKSTSPEISALIPSVKLMGDYTINGKVLILPIIGNGRSNLTMDNVKINIKLGPLAVTERKNQIYAQVDKIEISFSTTRFVAY